MKRTIAVTILLALCGSACSSETVDAEDEGKVCLGAPPWEPQAGSDAIEADQRLAISVTYDECLSACIRDEFAQCSVSLEGDRIVVQSEFSYREPAPGKACIAVCYALTAECQSPPLAAGDYTLVHGDRETPLAVPSSAGNSCFE
jgi:hypothetical protein